jgi:hypothetical protein
VIVRNKQPPMKTSFTFRTYPILALVAPAGALAAKTGALGGRVVKV